MTTVGDHLVGTVRDRQQMKDTGGEKIPVFKIIQEKLDVQEHSSIVSTIAIQNSFILGHASNGVLGTSTLGDDKAAAVVVAVSNPNNVWKEAIRTDTFDDSSTATWDITNHKWTF